MSLLESSPFLASLLMSYITEASQARASSSSRSSAAANDEEVTTLRDCNQSLREELENARMAQKLAAIEAQAERRIYEAEINGLKASRQKTEVALEEQLVLSEELLQKLAKYESDHEDSVGDQPPLSCDEMDLSKVRGGLGTPRVNAS
jgi:hypothetical protein